MFNKKAQIPVIKTIVIILTTVVIFTTFLIVLIGSSSTPINNKKINTQLVVNKLINSKCFSEEFATIENKNFNQNQLNKCFQGIDNTVLFRIKLSGKGYLYSGDEETFNQKKILCGTNRNILCTKLIYPITLISDDDKHNVEDLLVEIITN
jgi:hypothetical protein